MSTLGKTTLAPLTEENLRILNEAESHPGVQSVIAQVHRDIENAMFDPEPLDEHADDLDKKIAGLEDDIEKAE